MSGLPGHIITLASGGSVVVDARGFRAISCIPAAGSGAYATGTLTGTTIVADDTVTVGGKTYTFQAVLTNVANNVLLGASDSDSLDNLIAAINHGAGSGTLYAAATTANANVTAAAGAGDTLVATAIVGGLAGNAIATTATLTAGTWGAATLTGGGDTAGTLTWSRVDSREASSHTSLTTDITDDADEITTITIDWPFYLFTSVDVGYQLGIVTF